MEKTLSLISVSRLNAVLVSKGLAPQVTKTLAVKAVKEVIEKGLISLDEVKSGWLGEPVSVSVSTSYSPPVVPHSTVDSLTADIASINRQLSSLNSTVTATKSASETALAELSNLDDRICEVAEISKSTSVIGEVEDTVRKMFDSFKTKVTPEELTAIADRIPVATKVVKARTLFKLEALNYSLGGKTINFGDMDVTYYNDDAPTCLGDYIFNPQHLHSALIALHAPNIPINTWLGGERSTGKSEFVTQLANRLGRKLYRINFDEAMERAEFIGGDSVADGTVFWREGILTKAIQHEGAIVLLDELSFARPNALATLHSIVEPNPNRGLNIAETGRRISVAKDVVFFVADNTMGYGDASGSFSGTRDMNTALLDRFGFKLKFNYLPHAQESKLIESRIGVSPDVADAIVAFANSARQKVSSGVLTQPPSLRSLQAWAIGMKSGLPIELAFENAIIRSYPDDCHPELMALFKTFIDVPKLSKLI